MQSLAASLSREFSAFSSCDVQLTVLYSAVVGSAQVLRWFSGPHATYQQTQVTSLERRTHAKMEFAADTTRLALLAESSPWNSTKADRTRGRQSLHVDVVRLV